MLFLLGDIMKKIKKLIKKIRKHLKRRNDHWTLYLYYNGLLVKKLKIDKNEAPNENSYCITIRNKNIYKGRTSIIARPVRLLKNDEKHKKTYWGITHELGVEIGE
jgi:hypothetical protein